MNADDHISVLAWKVFAKHLGLTMTELRALRSRRREVHLPDYQAEHDLIVLAIRTERELQAKKAQMTILETVEEEMTE